MPNPVAYFEIGGRDAGQLREFYAALFGWHSEPSTPAVPAVDYSHVEAQEGGIPGGILQTTDEMPPNYVSIYVSVDDLQASLDKAETLGAKTIVPVTPIAGGMGHMAWFIDPAGNPIGMHKF